MVFEDAKWVAQLRLLLGTKFDELFVGPTAPADINIGETGQVNIRNLEKTLSQRILALIEYFEVYFHVLKCQRKNCFLGVKMSMKNFHFFPNM